MDIENGLRSWAAKRGYRLAWFGTALLTRALAEIRRLKEDGSLESAFFERVLAWMGRPEIAAQTEVKTVVLVAVPRPAHTATFDYRGKSHELVLPPTYHNYAPLFEEVRQDLEAELGRPRSLSILKGPLKTLAVWSGLARYGRNNIAYVDGFGSYHQLVGLAADFQLDSSGTAGPGGPGALDECAKCRACHAACPAGAISDERFLLHGERCLTYFSEMEGPLPEAYARLKRRCLVGCLACQEICPANPRPLPVEPLGVRFSEAETAFILGESPGAAAPPGLAEKIAGLKSNEFELRDGRPNPTFRRNLEAVLKASIGE